MKILQKFNLKPIHTTIIAFIISAIFFISAFSILSSSYNLSNYKSEFKEYGIDYDKVFDFNYIFNSYYTSVNGDINISSSPTDKILITIPFGKAVISNISGNNVFLYGDVHLKRDAPYPASFAYDYLKNTKTQSISLLPNVSKDNLYDAHFNIEIPYDFKGEVIIQSNDEVFNNTTNLNLKTVPLK